MFSLIDIITKRLKQNTWWYKHCAFCQSFSSFTTILLLFYFTFCKTYYPFQYHFSLLYFNILLFPFMDTNDLTCTCVFDFIAFTCRLNWMNYAFKFPFSYTLLPSLLPSQAILFFIQVKPNDNKVKMEQVKEYILPWFQYKLTLVLLGKIKNNQFRYTFSYIQYVVNCKVLFQSEI